MRPYRASSLSPDRRGARAERTHRRLVKYEQSDINTDRDDAFAWVLACIGGLLVSLLYLGFLAAPVVTDAFVPVVDGFMHAVGTTLSEPDRSLLRIVGVVAALAGLGLVGPLVHRRTKARHVRHRADEARQSEEQQATEDAWQRSCERHDRISLAHAEHESDLLAILDHPTLTDLNETPTRQLYSSLVTAQDLRTETMPGPAGCAAYAAAVAGLDLAWSAARQHADKVRLSGFEPEERARLVRARGLLTTALDQAATPAERQSCYAKAMKLVQGLVPVPDPAAKVLASRMAAELVA